MKPIVNPETNLDAQASPLVWWHVEKTSQDGPAIGKGVSVRLAGPRPDFLSRRIDSPETCSALHRQTSEPRSQLLLVVASALEPVLVSVKLMEPLEPLRSREDHRYAALLRGVTRAALSPGTVAIPVMYEPCCTRVGVLGSVGHRSVKRGKLRVGSRLRLTAASNLYATVREVHDLAHGSQLVVLSRTFPLLPGVTLVADDPDPGGRSVSGDRAGSVLVLGCYPLSDPVRKGAIRELVGKAAVRPPRPMNATELYGVLGVSAERDQAPPAPDSVRVGAWWVAPALLGRCEQALMRCCRRPGGGRSEDLRDALRREGVGPALGDALVMHVRSRIIERRGSVWLPVGGGPGDFLSLPARTLLARLEDAGTEGVDFAAERSRATGGAGVQLADLGLAIITENGRLFSVGAYQELTARAIAGIKAADGELHQRELSAVLGLSRNSTRALVGRMVNDGLIERASAVHVRVPAGEGLK